MSATRSLRCVSALLIGLSLGLMMTGGARAQGEVELQAIIDRTAPGATVTLPPGTYAGPVTIRQPLTLTVERAGETVLVNTSQRSAVTIEAERVTVSGLAIVDETVKEAPTVLVTGDRAALEDLHIRTGSHGIVAREANEGTVTRVAVEWVVPGIRQAEKGNGIDLYEAHRWRLTDSTIRDVHDGIYLENSDDTLVQDNVIERSRYGVHGMYTKRAVIRGNIGTLNVTGAMVMASRQATVAGNSFAKQSENVNSQGILLYDVQESVVEDNAIEGNRVGLYVEQSAGNVLRGNRVFYNFIGIQLLEASGNTITNNSFVGNVVSAQARGSEDNDMSGNLWDSFQGIDADGDGYSDISYAINPFFQGLAQRRSAFQLFFQSPGMVFLEGLYQTGRDRWANDAAPLMVLPDAAVQTDEAPRSGAGAGLVGCVLLAGVGLTIFRTRRRGT